MAIDSVKRPSGVRAARRALRQRLRPMRHELRGEVRKNLIPGFRERLLRTIRTLEEVRAADFDEELYVDYLAAITGTAAQTVRRWVDKSAPGLPDLVSFTTLCSAVGVDVAWMLGMATTRLQVAHTGSEWLRELVADIGRAGMNLVGVRAEAGLAESGVHPGDWILIDTNDNAWGASGFFAVAFDHSGPSTNVDTAEPSLLFIDRERSTLAALRELFGPGYKVTTAADGDKAIGLITRRYFDVIVCDDRMPRMTGNQLMRSVATISPATVRILMTDFQDNQVIVDALNSASAHRVVLKPWIDENLRRVVDESILLAKTLRQEIANSPPDPEAGIVSNGENPPAVDLPAPNPAFDATSANAEPIDACRDWPQDRMALCHIDAGEGGGFTVTSLNQRYGETHVNDAQHATELGIRLLGRVTTQLSLKPK